MKPRLVKPRTLKGFRDYPPAIMMPRESMMETARQVFRSFGFAPIDTPVLEYLEILTGKGSEETDRQIYQFTTRGGREVAMRFDLTVPLARFAAQHINEVGTPFRRYQIAPVWRGENPQAGRYREFVQCDFDTIGTQSAVSDIEAITVVNRLLEQLGFIDFTISINNRKILSSLLAGLGLTEKTTAVLRCVDKLQKVGRKAVADEMVQAAGVSIEQADAVLQLTDLGGESEAVLAALPDVLRIDGVGEDIQNESQGDDAEANEHQALGQAGIQRLSEVYHGAIDAGVPKKRLRLDVSIARGLDYYTGTIFETTLDDLPGIGSVCSGGRYDNLASLYTKQALPGIGGSLGLDRLLAAMEQLSMLPKQSTPAKIMVAFFDAEHQSDYLKLTSRLREAGIAVEMYPDVKKLGSQLKYADQKGFEYVIIAGGTEWANHVVQIKTLATKSSDEVLYQHDSPEALIKYFQ